MNRLRIFLCCIIAIPIGSWAQEKIAFTHVTYANGLSQSTINCMVQDRTGFLWLGTQGGLNRYDGNTVRSFQQEPGNARSLSDDNVQCLVESHDGKLLIGTMTGGLNIFDPVTEQFERHLSTDSPPLIPDNTIWALLADPDGVIWAGTNRGLARIDMNRRNYALFEPDTTGIHGFIFVLSICRISDGGDMYLGTSNGLYRFHPATGRITKLPGFNQIPIAKRSVWSVTIDPQGTVWMGTDTGLYYWNSIHNVIKPALNQTHGLVDPVIWSVLAVGRDQVWLGTNQGLIRYQTLSQQWIRYNHDQYDPGSLANDVVWSLLQDRSGMIWAGTTSGLSGYDPSVRKFMMIDSLQCGYRLQSVNAICEGPRNTLWIGSGIGGLYQMNRLDGTCRRWESGQSGLTSDQVFAIHADNAGRIWVGTYGGGLCCLQPGSTRFTAYRSRSDCDSCLGSDRVFAIEEDNSGNIWVGTRSGGLTRINVATGAIHTYRHDPENRLSLAGDVILSLLWDPRGYLWIGTFGQGLSRYDPATDAFTNFGGSGENGQPWPDTNIWALHIDHRERLWLGTSTGICLMPEPIGHAEFIHLGSRQGLPKGTVMGIVQDPQNNIWISTFRCLTKIHMGLIEKSLTGGSQETTGMVRNFNIQEGLQGNGFCQGASFAGEMGWIYFGGTNGINRFKADQVRDNGYYPPLALTRIAIYNQEVSIDPDLQQTSGKTSLTNRDGAWFIPISITHLKKLSISSKIKVLTLEFASLHFSRPANNQFAYKLENFDPDWNFTGNKHDATYTNLPPGHYRFQVKGTNSDGIWNPEPLVLELSITPQFHQTTLFLLLISLTGVLILTSILITINRLHRKKEEQKRAFAELQLKTVKNQIDPHFTFNVINTVAGMVYKGNPDRTYDYFSRFAKLIRTSLENSDRLKVTLSEEIEFIKNYLELEKARFPDEMEFFLHIDPDVRLDTEVPKMIMQIFVENAMKHGLRNKKEEKRLSVRVFPIGEKLVIEVEDNGIGREAASRLSDRSTGKGYEIIQKITELYRQLYDKTITIQVTDLYTQDSAPAGTRVVIIIQ